MLYTCSVHFLRSLLSRHFGMAYWHDFLAVYCHFDRRYCILTGYIVILADYIDILLWSFNTIVMLLVTDLSVLLVFKSANWQTTLIMPITFYIYTCTFTIYNTYRARMFLFELYILMLGMHLKQVLIWSMKQTSHVPIIRFYLYLGQVLIWWLV